MNKTYTIRRDEVRSITLEKSGVYTIYLAEPGAEVSIFGAFQAEKSEIVDVQVLIYHQAPNTRADTTLRGVARDSAQIKFLGRIIIDENCGNTNSFLTERVLLLSDKSKAECIPDLEIFSDEVRCSHAASVTKIPEDQLFYLMSRGITRREAEELIVAGFLGNSNV